MDGILPSKKYAVFLTATIVVVGLVLWLSSGRNADDERLTSATVQTENTMEDSGATSIFGSVEKLPENIIPLTDLVLDEEDARVGVSLKDLKIVNDESPTRLRAYGLSVASTLSKGGGDARDPLDIFFTMWDEPNDENLKMIDLLEEESVKDARLASELSKIEVPTSATTAHLSLIRAFGYRSQLLSIMASIEWAPLEAFDAANEYLFETNDMIARMEEINEYFRARGIAFNEAESAKLTVTSYE